MNIPQFKSIIWPFCLFCASLGSFTPLTSQNTPSCFGLFFPTLTAQPGDTICLPLMTRDFEQIVAMQFVTRWDTARLEPLNLDYYLDSDLPGLSPGYFWLNPSGRYLAMAWDDPLAMGQSLPDSSIIFNLCFKVKSGANGFAPIWIDRTGDPDYEITQMLPPDWRFVSMPFSLQPGGVWIGGGGGVEPLTIANACVTAATCNTPSGAVSLEISNGIPPYSFQWQGPGGFSDTSGGVLNGLVFGFYHYTVTDQQGWQASGDIYIDQTPSFIYAYSTVSPSDCGQNNGCATLTVSGQNQPFTYEWSAGSSQTAENCELPAGPNSVTITDQLGCSTVNNFEIPIDTAVFIDYTRQDIYSCGDLGAILVNVYPAGNYQFLWSTGETTQQISNLPAGVYDLTVTRNGGCSAVASIGVFDYSTQNWGLKLNPVCNPDDPSNGKLRLLYNSDFWSVHFPALVTWSNGSTHYIPAKPSNGSVLDSLGELPQGYYTATVSSEDGCVQTIGISLLCNQLPPAPDGFSAFYIKDEYLSPQYAVDSCGGVYGRNLAGLNHIAFSLDWQNTNASLREIRNLHLPEMSQNNFTLNSGQTELGFDWSGATPLNFNGDSLLFEVCFDLHSGSQAIDLAFSEQPVAPKLRDEAGEEKAFIGRAGYVLTGLYFPAGPSVCRFAVTAPSCKTDDLYRIFLETCDPDKNPGAGTWSRLDQNGNLSYGGDLNALLFAQEGLYRISAWQAASSTNNFLAYLPPVSNTPECVWPGDADNNNAVNQYDLLYLGIAFGTEGPQRNNPSTEWIGQECADWPQSTQIRHVNYKNIDTNGDGLVNAADTSQIVAHWGEVINPGVDNPFASPQSNVPGLQFPQLSVPSDTVQAGEVVNLPLALGSSDTPMDNVYGLAFSISYDPGLLEDQVYFRPSNSWFGDSTQYLYIQKNYPLQGHLDVAITRTDGQAVSGWGPIGNLFIIIEDDIFGDPSPAGPQDTTLKTRLFLNGVRSVNAAEKSMGIEAVPAELVLKRTASPVKELPEQEQTIRVTPNPANDVVRIETTALRMSRVELCDWSGRKLQQLEPEAQSLTLAAGALADGSYILRILTDKGLFIKKIQIIH